MTGEYRGEPDLPANSKITEAVALENRLTKLETRSENFSTKTDIANIKSLISSKESSLWRWILGAFITAGLSLIAIILRLFFSVKFPV